MNLGYDIYPTLPGIELTTCSVTVRADSTRTDKFLGRGSPSTLLRPLSLLNLGLCPRFGLRPQISGISRPRFRHCSRYSSGASCLGSGIDLVSLNMLISSQTEETRTLFASNLNFLATLNAGAALQGAMSLPQTVDKSLFTHLIYQL